VRRPGTIYTVGHSTRSEQELLGLLEPFGVRAVADVRRFPGSRRHPHYNQEALARWLEQAGIRYLHVPELGGRRAPASDSGNAGWREAAFRGYADHMSSEEFASGLRRLEELARERPTAIMCAEALWWRCHRRLIADVLTVKGWEVEHLGLRDGPVTHELPSFAVVDEGRLTYPPQQPTLL
jgi:uncharacterized protein (DUF488 family)